MKNEEEVEIEVEQVTPSSSPPTPPSPLPISVGPGNSKYYFSSSPSASPPFSPHISDHDLPLIPKEQESKKPSLTLSTFSLSLDQPSPSSRFADSSSNAGSSCLQDLLEWFAIRCCSCCSWTLNPPSKPHHS